MEVIARNFAFNWVLFRDIDSGEFWRVPYDELGYVFKWEIWCKVTIRKYGYRLGLR